MNYRKMVLIQLIAGMDGNANDIQAVCAKLEKDDVNLDVSVVEYGAPQSIRPSRLCAMVMGGRSIVDAPYLTEKPGELDVVTFCDRITEVVSEARERKIEPLFAGSNTHLPPVPPMVNAVPVQA